MSQEGPFGKGPFNERGQLTDRANDVTVESRPSSQASYITLGLGKNGLYLRCDLCRLAYLTAAAVYTCVLNTTTTRRLEALH